MKTAARRKKPRPISLKAFAKGKRTDFYLPLYEDALGNPLTVPFIVARGTEDGPVLGLTAALHGNELNGIKIIQNLLSGLDLATLRGSLVCAPVVNIPGYNDGTRYFIDGVDLNHAFPGRAAGTPSQQFAWTFSSAFLPAIEYLIDIHTASQGRANTLYVRANWRDNKIRELAAAVNPDIILHSPGGEGTLRSAARRSGVAAITVEAGNPSVLQGKMVFAGERGIRNAMIHLGMLEGAIAPTRNTVICKSSQWLRTVGGGILETKFALFDRLAKGQLIAMTVDPFGEVLQEYFAPHDGIVIGKAKNPVAIPGTRFCHLGNPGEPELYQTEDDHGQPT